MPRFSYLKMRRRFGRPLTFVVARSSYISRRIKAEPYKLLYIWLPFFFYEANVIYVIISYFVNPKKDTIALTNIGFAMAIGIASICFSWVKTLDTETDKSIIRNIKKTGEIAFFVGFMFLMASVLKFGQNDYKEGQLDPFKFFKILSILMGGMSGFLFAMSFLLSGKIIKNIMSIIYQRNNLNRMW